jgi:MarR family 2-MHQ and catechol resistance regulon transcriptional repressor
MPTHFQGTERQRRTLDAYIKLLRAGNAVQAEATRHLAEYGLTPSQFGVLEALYHLGPLCLGELASKILRTAGNLTMVVDNLEKRGLARRASGQSDRRFVTVEITDKGMDLIGRVLPEHVVRIEERMSRLSRQEQATLAALCRKLGPGETSAGD